MEETLFDSAVRILLKLVVRISLVQPISGMYNYT